jgi:GTP cyclohydrolase III
MPTKNSNTSPPKFRVSFEIWSDMDRHTPVHCSEVEISAVSPREAKSRAIQYLHDNHPACDERIHPSVVITKVEQVEDDEDAASPSSSN